MNERIEAPEEEPMEGREEVSKSEGASLDEATVDPEARVEREGDYTEAEAIESAVVTLIDEAPETPPESKPASLDKDGEGSETFDPRKEYSSVEMDQGEVLQDDDWNEGQPREGDSPNQVAMITGDRSPETPPVEEISNVDHFVSALGLVEDEVEEPRVPSKHSAKIEPLPPREPSGDHLESQASTARMEGSSSEIPVSVGFDAKPIPAATEPPQEGGETDDVDLGSGEVSLDRNGDDVPALGTKGDEVVLDRKGDDGPALEANGDEVSLDRKGDDKPALGVNGDDVALDRKGDDGPALEARGEEVTLDRKGDDGPATEGKGVELTDAKWGGPSYADTLDPQDFEVLDRKRPGKESESTPSQEMDLRGALDMDNKAMDLDPVDLDNKAMDPDPVLRKTLEQGEHKFSFDAKNIEIARTNVNIAALEELEVDSAQTVIGRAVLDPDYREMLQTDLDQALEEYDVSPAEREALAAIDIAELNRIAETFISRLSISEGESEGSSSEIEAVLRALLDVSSSVLKLDDLDAAGPYHRDSKV